MNVEEKLRQAGMDYAAQRYGEIARRAVTEKWSYAQTIGRLLDDELEGRRERKGSLYLQLAHFPVIKTFEEFDFSFNLSKEKASIEELKEMSFVQRHQNVVLLGPPGVGKTHIAIALGVEAVKNGFQTYFTTLDEIMRKLKTTKDENFVRKIKRYVTPRLLIIDEMGYTPLCNEEANVLFQIINERYEKASIIITSNKSIMEWGDYLGDEVLASAILDRLLHHSYTFNIRGNSYRLKDKLKYNSNSNGRNK